MRHKICRTSASLFQIFLDLIENFADYDPACLLVYFCRMLHCNLSIEPSKVTAKSLADKEDLIAMMERTTISVALRHTLQQSHVICWIRSQLDMLDPRVSYYLYGFLEEDKLEQQFVKFRSNFCSADFSCSNLQSLVTFACCVPNCNISGHVSSYLKTSEHAYWELTVCVLKLLPSLTKKEFRSIVSLLSHCGHLVPKTAFGLLTNAILMLTNTSDLSQECCANLIENYSCSVQELIKDLEDEGTFVSVFLDACRLLTELPQYLKPSGKAIVLEMTARCSGGLREVLRIVMQNLDGSEEDVQQVLKVFSN